MMGISEWLLVAVGILTAIYIWISYHYSYWRRKNVPFIEPNPLFGNLKEMLLVSCSPAEHLTNLYNHKISQDQPIVGIHVFNKPALIVREPELIKTIMIKDFNKFSNRFTACDAHSDALGSYNLFFLKNPLWREIRAKVSPVFTSGKLKQMFPLVEEIGSSLDKYLGNLPLDSDNSCTLEIKNTSVLYTTDVIASVAYGINANSFKDPNGAFVRLGKNIFGFTMWRAFEWTVLFFLPHLASLFSCKFISKKNSKFIRDTINYTMAERIKSGTQRNDLIDVLVSFQKAAEFEKDKNHFVHNNDMLVSQAAVFFTAGYETGSSTISFGLYELSQNPEIQKRLRQEIKDALVKSGGKITYEMLKDMEYLHMFVSEVLRLYPALPFLDRECTLSKNEKEVSLKPHSEFCVPNGMPLYIPLFAIHRDPKYFANPEKFDPERFSVENKPNILPYTYMPFGIGPHNCIGERLGLATSKIGIISYLKNHYVTTCKKSMDKMEFDPKALMVSAKGGIYCKLVRDPLV